MDYIDFWNQLHRAMKKNEDYQEAAREIHALEPDYLAAVANLTEAQQEQVERYIAACDTQSDSMILQAYRLGYEKGRLDPLVLKSGEE